MPKKVKGIKGERELLLLQAQLMYFVCLISVIVPNSILNASSCIWLEREMRRRTISQKKDKHKNLRSKNKKERKRGDSRSE
jgi:hypothetical protein